MGKKIYALAVIFAFSSAVIACSAGSEAQEERDSGQDSPALTEKADATGKEAWRSVDPDNLLILTLESGDVFIELAPGFAPQNIAQIKKAVRDSAFQNEYFYRVISGHVAQGGLEFDQRLEPWSGVPLEAERAIIDGAFIEAGTTDLWAPQVGHIDGFPAAQSEGQEWLLHCPGALGMARDEAPDTGAIEFYITLGPRRYLDQNYSVMGRVLSGMPLIHALKRVEPSGETAVKALFSDNAAERQTAQLERAERLAPNRILKAEIASMLPEEKRPVFEVMKANSQTFKDLVHAATQRTHPTYVSGPPQVFDICAFEARIRETSIRRVN